MEIEIINKEINLNPSFALLAKTDRICPTCGKKGLIVKYRYNGKIGFFHKTSGILLSCENWDGCSSLWNKGTKEEIYPWHTWLGSFHIPIDKQRGNWGAKFLNNLHIFHPELLKIVLEIDKRINENAEIVNK